MALSNFWCCLVQHQNIHTPLNQFFFLLLPLYARSVSFNFSTFQPDYVNITFQGEAYPIPNALQLTKDTNYGSLNYSAGRASYHEAVQLWDNSKGRLTLTDFTTHFSFVINAINMSNSGDGLSFFIAPFDSEMLEKSAGGFLGLFSLESAINASGNQIVAVEFDSFKNPWDPSDDHVGINVNSIVSKANVTWNSSIKSGKTANAWIGYNATTKNLSVFLTYADDPFFNGNCSLSYIVDLSTVLPKRVRVGFSAATGGLFESHKVLSWSFSSSLDTGNGNKENKVRFKVGLGVGLGAVNCGFCLLWYICWRKRVGGKKENLHDDVSMDDEFEKGTGPRRFTYRELARATNNFANGGKLGEGGFGVVYKGVLSESKAEVAVKRVSRGSKQGKKEYMSEVKIIGRLRHRNLVQLIGWCHEQAELLLVYEYMPNRSLDFHLFGARIMLTWPIRYKITLGLASALLYLHEEWEQCVVHRDLKPSNIMLDSNFNAKLGDFGLARLVDHELGSQTTILAGTIGYLAPESVTTGKASKESDVYSFGVISLEIVCGRKPFEPQEEPSKIKLVEWVWDHYGKGQPLEVADKGLNIQFDKRQIECLIVVGLWCCHPNSTVRPTIRQVLNVLNFEAPLPKLPSKLPVPMYFVPPKQEFTIITH